MNNSEYHYFRNLLAQIIKGEQEELKEVINAFLLDTENKVLFDLTIAEAIVFLQENYEYIEKFIK